MARRGGMTDKIAGHTGCGRAGPAEVVAPPGLSLDDGVVLLERRR